MPSAKRQSRATDNKASTSVLPVQEVTANTWVPFFSDMNNRHRGDRVDVEILDGKGGTPRIEWKKRRLQSISSMLGRPGEPDAISITVSEDDQRLVNRTIPDVRHVRLFSVGGEDEKLEVESADGDKVILVFRR